MNFVNLDLPERNENVIELLANDIEASGKPSFCQSYNRVNSHGFGGGVGGGGMVDTIEWEEAT